MKSSPPFHLRVSRRPHTLLGLSGPGRVTQAITPQVGASCADFVVQLVDKEQPFSAPGFSESTKGHPANWQAASSERDTGRTLCLALIGCRSDSPGPTSRGLLCLLCSHRLPCPWAPASGGVAFRREEPRRARVSLLRAPLTLSEKRPSWEGRPVPGSPLGPPPP